MGIRRGAEGRASTGACPGGEHSLALERHVCNKAAHCPALRNSSCRDGVPLQWALLRSDEPGRLGRAPRTYVAGWVVRVALIEWAAQVLRQQGGHSAAGQWHTFPEQTGGQASPHMKPHASPRAHVLSHLEAPTPRPPRWPLASGRQARSGYRFCCRGSGCWRAQSLWVQACEEAQGTQHDVQGSLPKILLGVL